MNILIEERFLNSPGNVKNLSFELEYNPKISEKEIIISGFIIFTREIIKESDTLKRITKIIDKLPIEITIPKKNLINKNESVSLHLNNLNYEIQDNAIIVNGELSLTNIERTNQLQKV